MEFEVFVSLIQNSLPPGTEFEKDQGGQVL